MVFSFLFKPCVKSKERLFVINHVESASSCRVVVDVGGGRGGGNIKVPMDRGLKETFGWIGWGDSTF